jgi:hypothetical protein
VCVHFSLGFLGEGWSPGGRSVGIGSPVGGLKGTWRPLRTVGTPGAMVL